MMKHETAQELERTTARATRVNLNLSEESRADLDRLAKAARCNLTELIRFGLMLVKLYYDSPPDEKLAVVKDGKLLKEILPPWGF